MEVYVVQLETIIKGKERLYENFNKMVVGVYATKKDCMEIAVSFFKTCCEENSIKIGEICSRITMDFNEDTLELKPGFFQLDVNNIIGENNECNFRTVFTVNKHNLYIHNKDMENTSNREVSIDTMIKDVMIDNNKKEEEEKKPSTKRGRKKKEK